MAIWNRPYRLLVNSRLRKNNMYWGSGNYVILINGASVTDASGEGEVERYTWSGSYWWLSWYKPNAVQGRVGQREIRCGGVRLAYSVIKLRQRAANERRRQSSEATADHTGRWRGWVGLNEAATSVSSVCAFLSPQACERQYC